jgi:hypothetical protein
MKKLLAVVIIFAVLATPASAELYHALILNESEMDNTSSYYYERYIYKLTENELFAAFPGFERFAPVRSASAEYIDERLAAISLSIEKTDVPLSTLMTGIYILSSCDQRYWVLSVEPEVSDVWGIPVTAKISEWLGTNDVEARFKIDDIFYQVILTVRNDYDYIPWLEYLVNEIIRSNVIDGYKVDLSVLDFFSLPFTTSDALLVLRAVAGLAELTDAQIARFGIDGEPVTADALRILQIVAGL